MIKFLSLEEKICAYYEVEIKLGGLYDQTAIGFTSDTNYFGKEFAGYLNCSIAYHGDDGNIYLNGDVVNQVCSSGSTDIIGCGITNHGRVFYCRNGELLVEVQTEFRGRIHPICSLRGKYSAIKVNFEGEFVFNIENFFEKKQSILQLISPLLLEAIFFQEEWQEILQELNQLNPQDWLSHLNSFISEERNRWLQYKERYEKESDFKNGKLETEKDFDVLKELQNIGKILFLFNNQI